MEEDNQLFEETRKKRDTWNDLPFLCIFGSMGILSILLMVYDYYSATPDYDHVCSIS